MNNYTSFEVFEVGVGGRCYIYSNLLNKYLRKDSSIQNSLNGWGDWFDTKREADYFLSKFRTNTSVENRLDNIEARLARIEENFGL